MCPDNSSGSYTQIPVSRMGIYCSPWNFLSPVPAKMEVIGPLQAFVNLVGIRTVLTNKVLAAFLAYTHDCPCKRLLKTNRDALILLYVLFWFSSLPYVAASSSNNCDRGGIWHPATCQLQQGRLLIWEVITVSLLSK